MSAKLSDITSRVARHYLHGYKKAEILNFITIAFPNEVRRFSMRFVRDTIRSYLIRLRRLEAGAVDRRKFKKLSRTLILFIETLTYRTNGYITAKELSIKIRRVFNKQVSPSTIAKCRQKLGFGYRRSRYCPKIFSTNEKNERLLFAYNNLNNDFKNTVFVDETSLMTKRSGVYHNRKKSSRPKNAGQKPRSVETLNIWGGISYNGSTEFVMFTQTLTKEGYKVMIENYLVQFMNNYPGSCRLIQDNATPHSAAFSMDILNENNIRWIKLPPYSPDMNIIELLWSELKLFIRKEYCPDLQSLIQRVNLFFRNELTLDKLRNYVERIKEVLPIIVEREGGWSDC